ncbi:DUF3426 domain-containing protein [Cellvibrio mixtus]|uniref:DUF3426 domain-containing protein n=1 Tax=Cellvibrio mixtus TaxID=39650 RepID=UPI0005868E21|nr:DUF3426 domain-containing protein [Cellvibrio mixtus]
MTSASNQQITRCPKCGTAFRITQAQLQSANGAVRCGSCLNVFKAMDYLVAAATPKIAESPTPVDPIKTAAPEKAPAPANAKPEASTKPLINPISSIAVNSPPAKPATTPAAPAHKVAATTSLPTNTPANQPEQLAILSSIKPLPIAPTPVSAAPLPKLEPQKPVVRVLDKSSLSHGDDILISDDMDDTKSDTKSYEFDSFMDIDTTPKAEVSLFERKIRHQDDKEDLHSADESWAEMLIDDEDQEAPRYVAQKKPVIANDEDLHANDYEANAPVAEPSGPAPSAPGLMFSLIGEAEPAPPTPAEDKEPGKVADDFILSDELASIPDHNGFKAPQANPTPNAPDPSIFETPDENATQDDSPKRQVKTQPKIRAYDGSRTALLMNIIPAPIEFTAKRMRRWYQRKLWPALSLLALLALVVQLAWFKFDYFSRVEPYRTAYTFICPYLKCEVPSLIDTSQILAYNLVIGDHPTIENALEIDVLIVNNAPFEQPYPDLELVFTNIDENVIASRRFSPGEYLGGEAAGTTHMPRKQPVHLTFDVVDPGEQAVNYRVKVLRQQNHPN